MSYSFNNLNLAGVLDTTTAAPLVIGGTNATAITLSKETSTPSIKTPLIDTATAVPLVIGTTASTITLNKATTATSLSTTSIDSATTLGIGSNATSITLGSNTSTATSLDGLTMNIGTTAATAVNIGRTGQTTTIGGSLTNSSIVLKQSTLGIEGEIYYNNTTKKINFHNGTGFTEITGSSGGDVAGPTAATDDAIVRYDGLTGKIIQNSLVNITDVGDIIPLNPNNNTIIRKTFNLPPTITGSSNVFLGYDSAKQAVAMNNGISIGEDSSRDNNTTTAGSNYQIGIGNNTYVGNGSSNISIGVDCGGNLATVATPRIGNNNICLGNAAGSNNTTITSAGSDNVFIGSSANGDWTLNNQIAIGKGANTTLVNECCIGNNLLSVIRTNGDNICDIGSTTKQFKNLYLNGGVYVGGVLQTFGGSGSTQTYTIGFQQQGTAVSVSVSATKTGDLITLNIPKFTVNTSDGASVIYSTVTSQTFLHPTDGFTSPIMTGINKSCYCQLKQENATWYLYIYPISKDWTTSTEIQAFTITYKSANSTALSSTWGTSYPTNYPKLIENLVVPTLTSDTSDPNFTLSGDGITDRWRAFDNNTVTHTEGGQMFDLTTGLATTAFQFQGVNGPWIKITLNETKRFNQYSLFTINIATRTITSWRLLGSNDNSTWTTIDDKNQALPINVNTTFNTGTQKWRYIVLQIRAKVANSPFGIININEMDFQFV